MAELAARSMRQLSKYVTESTLRCDFTRGEQMMPIFFHFILMLWIIFHLYPRFSSAVGFTG